MLLLHDNLQNGSDHAAETDSDHNGPSILFRPPLSTGGGRRPDKHSPAGWAGGAGREREECQAEAECTHAALGATGASEQAAGPKPTGHRRRGACAAPLLRTFFGEQTAFSIPFSVSALARSTITVSLS